MMTTLSTLSPNKDLLNHGTFQSYKLSFDDQLERLDRFKLARNALKPKVANASTKASWKWLFGVSRNGLLASDEFGGAFFFDAEGQIQFLTSDGGVVSVVGGLLASDSSGWPSLSVPRPGFILTCDGMGAFTLLQWSGSQNEQAIIVGNFRLSTENRPTEILDSYWPENGPLEVLTSAYDATSDLDRDEGTKLPLRDRPGLGSKSFAERRVAQTPQKRVFSVSFAAIDPNTGSVTASTEVIGADPAISGYIEATYGGEAGAFAVVSASDFVSPGSADKPSSASAGPSPSPAPKPNSSEATAATTNTTIEEGIETLEAAKDPEQPTLLSQLESADAVTNPVWIFRFSSDGTCTGVNNCAGHSFIATGLRSHGIPPELLFGYDVDGTLYALQPGSAEASHVCSFPALSYVSSSKRDRKFVGYLSNYDFWFVAESSRLLFLYATPDAGQRSSSQYVLDLKDDGNILGFAQVDSDTLVILKESAVYRITLRRDMPEEGRDEGRGFSQLDELLDRTGDTQLAGMMGDY